MGVPISYWIMIGLYYWKELLLWGLLENEDFSVAFYFGLVMDIHVSDHKVGGYNECPHVGPLGHEMYSCLE